MTQKKMLITVAILIIGFTTTVSATGSDEKSDSITTPAIVSSTSTATTISIPSTAPSTTINTSTKPSTSISSPTPLTTLSTSTKPSTSISSTTLPTTINTSTKPSTSISSTTPSTDLNTSTKPSTSIFSTTPSTTINTSTTPITTSIFSTTPSTTINTSTTPTTTSIFSTTPSTTINTSTTPTTTSIFSTTPSTTINTSTTPTTTSILSTTPSTTINTSTTPTTTSISSTTPPTTINTSTTPIPTYPPSLVKISETNILFTALENNLFVELTGKPNETLQGWSISVYNASSPQQHNDVSSIPLNGTLDAEGRKIISKITQINLNWTAFSALESVLVVLYYKVEMDFLLYSSKGEIDPGIAENYPAPNNLIFDMKDWTNKTVSVSRCFPANDTAGFVLTQETRGAPNHCTFSHSQNLEMKLILKGCKVTNLPPDYSLTSTNLIVTEVNKRKKCGFSRFMVKDFSGSTNCSDDKNHVYFKFQVMYDLPTQWDLIQDGYQSFILDKSSVFKLAGYDWMISNCTEHCLPVPAVKPPDAGDDDRIRVTVAVVVSCIGVFLIVLIFVIIYMKNKRRGILQFRMTRLDDDEDDLIGDMDDFVGNQGPTFRNFS